MSEEYTIRYSDIANNTWLFRIDGESYEIPAGSVKLYEVNGNKCAKCEDVKGLALS